MPEVIQDWLGTRLGILLDTSPQKFGENAKDGQILAKVLYHYGVIPDDVFTKIKESENYCDCYSNLIILKPWLEHIGVTHEDSALQKMAGGEGSAAISIFYAVYLNLERKDRFFYVSALKERKFSEDSCLKRFKVDWVPEREIMRKSVHSSSKLAMPLVEKRDLIENHREKCKEVVEIIKITKDKFAKKVCKEQPKPLGLIISKHKTSQPIDKCQLEAVETRERINSFEKSHPQNYHDLTYSELMKLKNLQETQPCFSVPNFTEAANIVKNIKRRKQDEIYARDFQTKLQHMLLDEQWKMIIENQGRDFENTVCMNLLKQSQYEKQMANKLHQVRNQKKVFAENRSKIECLKIEQKEKEYEDLVNIRMEVRGEYWEDGELEKKRIAELHRRLYDHKVKARREQIRVEARKICEALVDIAIRVAEAREFTACQVPKSFMKDLKELFFKDLSIFDILDNYEELHEMDSRMAVMMVEEDNGEEEVFYRAEECQRMKNEEEERLAVLDECDWNDYINLLGPWMVELLFPDAVETEVKHLVLGYVVHKLLGIKYPLFNLPAPAAIKPMKPTAVVQGLLEENACKMLMDLMEACRILVVRVDDAINFVLATYKDELSVVREIDINFQKVTANALKDKTANVKEAMKKIQLLKKKEEKKPPSPEDDFNMLDKQTQTPRILLEEDPTLSPSAKIGKMAFEALGAGDPVPDPVVVSAVVAYVASKQEDYDGWILLNYPLLYYQARELECALTGYSILPIDNDTESLEDVEGFTYRDPCVNPFAKDNFGASRLSKLVPQPDVCIAPPPEVPDTYFDTFIMVKKIRDSSRRKSQESNNVGPLEKFYSNLGILLNFEYLNLNFQSVKNLAKAILVEVSQPHEDYPALVPKSSLEIFGKIVLELNEKWELKKKSIKGTETEKVTKEAEKIKETVYLDEVEGARERKRLEKKIPEMPTSTSKPGDSDWEWATGPQPEYLQIALASLWENMEAAYVEDFKNVFFSLRVHRFNVLSYSAFIKKSVRILMRRPDEKQNVLGEFQQIFNEIDVDLRPDVDIKYELHVRVAELEEALMEMADEQKANSLRDLTKVAQDYWVPDQMATLVNAYLTALQLEADRCVDTCQVIMDYYISLQQKIPDERPLGKVVVSKLQIKDRKYSITSSSSNKLSLNTPRNSDIKRSNKSLLEQGSGSNFDRASKTRSLNERRKKSSEICFLTGAAEVINGILMNLSLPDDGLTPFHIFFVDTVEALTTEIKTIVEGCLSETKKMDKTPTKMAKKASDTKIKPSGNLSAEWTAALEDELSRFLFRMKLILARGTFEMNEFLMTMLNILSSLAEEIEEMYLKEIKSISECCKVFRCGVEEEIGIQSQLELKQDEFIVKADVFMFPSPQEIVDVAVDDGKRNNRFTIDQLCILRQKLQRVAPNGEIIKRSLVYIFQDLRMLKLEVEGISYFPEIWYDIEPEDLTLIINEVYQELEIVHWKDFIIYAMDLTMPTESEILSLRQSFREFDPLVTELISRKNYDCVEFWFEGTLDNYARNEKAKDLLYRMYQVNEHQTNYSALLLAFCKDEDPVLGFEKALALAMGVKIAMREFPQKFMSFDGEGVFIEDYGSFEDHSRSSMRKPDCCNTTSVEIKRKCIPKEKIVRCECKDFLESTTAEEEEEKMEFAEEVGENAYYYDSRTSLSSTASTVPFSILSSLLKASYPSLPQLSVLLDCKQTFQETLNSVYDSLESHGDGVEVHKLLHHKFIHQLLHATNKFKLIKIRNIVTSTVELRNSTVPSACSPDILSDNLCQN